MNIDEHQCKIIIRKKVYLIIDEFGTIEAFSTEMKQKQKYDSYVSIEGKEYVENNYKLSSVYIQ